MFRRKVSYHKIIQRKLAYVRFTRKMPAGLRLFLNSIRKWWDRWVPYFLLSLVWLLAAATVIVSPPITFGVFYALRDPDEMDERLKVMLVGAKKYAGPAYLNFLISLAVYALVIMNTLFYASIENPWFKVLAGFSIAVLIAWLGIQITLIPVMFQQKTTNLFYGYRNAGVVFLANFLDSGFLLVMVILVTALSILFPPLVVLGTPVLVMLYIHSMVSRTLLKLKFIQPEDTYYQDSPDDQEQKLLAVYEDAVEQEKKSTTRK